LKKSIYISLKQINRAIFDVQNELYLLGLWYEGAPLTMVEIYSCPIPLLLVKGFFYHGENTWSKMAGYSEGKMYIQQISIAYLNSQPDFLRDVIRHEYAHSYAHHYPELIFKTEFSKVFGGSYYYNKPSKMHASS
jgi:hypothetical protein